MRFIVVPGGDCEEAEGESCIMELVGPFENNERERAVKIMNFFRDSGFTPHWMTPSRPEDFEQDE